MPLRVKEILLGVPGDARHRIQTIVDTYRDRIRDAARDSVLLSLGGRRRQRHSVTVELRDGAPRVVAETMFGDDLGVALTATESRSAPAQNAWHSWPEFRIDSSTR